MTLVASCHCGATQIELPHPPTEAHECNCTLCARIGAVWAYYPPDALRLVSATHDKVYSASQGTNQHHFCANCGGNTHGDSPDWESLYNLDGTLKPGMSNGVPTTRIAAVNLRMIGDFDLGSVAVTKVDGRNNW